jgi:6-methylsalicylic acid synthase
MGTIGADEAVRALDLAMRDGQPNIVVLPVLPAAVGVPMLADVAPTELDVSAAAESVAGSFFGDDGGPDPELVAERVVAAVAAQLGISDGDLDTGLPLVEIGVDSIMTVGLLRQLEKQTGLSLPPTLLWEYPTAAAVSGRITELLSSPDVSEEPREVPVS